MRMGRPTDRHMRATRLVARVSIRPICNIRAPFSLRAGRSRPKDGYHGHHEYQLARESVRSGGMDSEFNGYQGETANASPASRTSDLTCDHLACLAGMGGIRSICYIRAPFSSCWTRHAKGWLPRPPWIPTGSGINAVGWYRSEVHVYHEWGGALDLVWTSFGPHEARIRGDCREDYAVSF